MLGRSGSEIEFFHQGESATGYRAVPSSGRGRGVLLLHETAGLVGFARDACDRLAREGFTALAPDLHAGRTGADPEAARRLMMDLAIEPAARILDAAIAELLNAECVEGPRVGAVGFCMGGPLALLAAARNRRVGAVVSFYGAHPGVGHAGLPGAGGGVGGAGGVTLDLSGLEAAVLGIFAEADEELPADAVADLREKLEAVGKTATLRVQPGVRHGFMNHCRPDVHDAVAAAAGWDAAVSFLRAELS